MEAVELVLILLAAAAALDLLARRLTVPQPVMLVLGGLVLAMTPGLPHARLDPDVVFLIFVPPILYRAALTTSWRDFRVNLRTILLLAIGLVLVTTAAVAAVAHRLEPSLTWPAAFALGAIVAPPDPIAATAVTRHLGAPRTIGVILEGEGLVNDATALVAYRMAVDAAVTGGFSLSSAVVRFAVAAVGGVGVGLAVAWTVVQIRRRLHHLPEIENAISLLTPFAAYIPAERLGASGILAVLTAGLLMGREGPRMISPETRVQGSSMWGVATFVLESLIFILIGLDLPLVTSGLQPGSLGRLVRDGAIVSAVAVAVRMAWAFPGAYLPRKLQELRGRRPQYPGWRNVLFVAWAGMRGADSLVIALALPLVAGSGPFPGRESSSSSPSS